MEYNKKLFKTYLLYFIVIVAFVLLRVLASVGAFSFIDSSFWQSNIATIVIQIIIMGALPIFMFMKMFKKGFKQTLKDIGFKKISLKSVLICLAMGVLVYILNVIVASLFNMILAMFGYFSGSGEASSQSINFINFLLSTIFVAALPAIFEEVTHRGILMRNVASVEGYKKAIIISSVLFGLMHLNVSQCFYAIFIGIIIGFVSSMSGSIFPAIILHFMNNFINVYFSYASQGGWLGGNLLDSFTSLLSNMNVFSCLMFCVIFVAIICGLLIYLMFKLFKETRYKEITNSLINVAIIVNETEVQNLNEQQIHNTFYEYIAPYIKNETIIDAMLPYVEADNKNVNLKTNLFKICVIFLGCLITFFTFLWGII